MEKRQGVWYNNNKTLLLQMNDSMRISPSVS